MPHNAVNHEFIRTTSLFLFHPATDIPEKAHGYTPSRIRYQIPLVLHCPLPIPFLRRPHSLLYHPTERELQISRCEATTMPVCDSSFLVEFGTRRIEHDDHVQRPL